MMKVVLLVAASLMVTVNAVDWPSTNPWWPHYPTRKLQVLNGTWSFGYAGPVPDAITIPASAANTPNTTQVPSAFDVEMPGVEGPRGLAWYRTTFDIASSSSSSMIQFGACSFYCKVFVDGQFVMDHRASGYAPFWVDTPQLSAGSHELLVAVDNRFNSTTAPLHTGGDFYNYGGLTREVIVHETPALRLQRVEIFTKDYKDGVVDVNVVVSGSTSGVESIDVQYAFDGASPSAAQSVAVSGGVAKLSGLKVPNPKPWSPSSPNLHTMTVSLLSSGGSVSDAIHERFGLRQLSMKKPSPGAQTRLYINDELWKGHGVNRHTMWPDTGSSVTPAQNQADLALLKELNVNYVRGAHYPQELDWLDLMDEAGIVMWQETLGPGVQLKDLQNPYFMKYQVQAMNDMISASINKPSFCLAGFNNEGPSGDSAACPGYNVSANVIRERMQGQALVTWASNQDTHDKCLAIADVISFNNYPSWYNSHQPAEFWGSQAQWIGQNFPDKPFFVSETGAGGVYEWMNSTVPPPKWSQEFQRNLIWEDASFIVRDDRFSGLTLWQFNDIKANTGDTKSCGQCDYKPNVEPPTCAYIDVTCKRPGGENHKGQVDFWRRKKITFSNTSALYASV